MIYSLYITRIEEIFKPWLRPMIAERDSEHRTHTVKGNMSGSTLAEHARDSGHDIDWDSCKVVDKQDYWNKGNI